MQHKENNVLFMSSIFLNRIVKLTNIFILPLSFASILCYIFQYPVANTAYILFLVAICLLTFAIINKILNIPLEYDASKRALKYLKQNKILSESEYKKAKKLLNIAAQTYIASLFDGHNSITRNFIFNLCRT